MGKLRAAMHNGKKSQKTGKVIRPPHNDTDREKNPNVIADMVCHNIYYNCYDDIEYTLAEQENMEVISFQEAELLFYQNNYQQSLDEQNARHLKARQKDRIKTMNDWLDIPRYSPTETILHVGNVDDGFANLSDMKSMTNAYVDSLRSWSAEHNDCLHILDYAIHTDEFYLDDNNEKKPSSIHTHIHYVFDYTDENGNKAIGIEKALEQAGYNLPKPNEKMGRYNNRMMVFTAEFREVWQNIAIAQGYDIETEPLPTKRKSKDRETYVAEKLAKKELQKAIEMQREAELQRIKNDEAAAKNATEEQRLAALKKELDERDAEISARDNTLKTQEAEFESYKTDEQEKINDNASKITNQARIENQQLLTQNTALQENNSNLQQEIQDKRNEIATLADVAAKFPRKKINPFSRKEDTFIMNREQYDEYIDSCKNIKQLVNNTLTSDEDKRACAEARQQQEKLIREYEQRIQQQAQEITQKVVAEYEAKSQEYDKLIKNEKKYIITKAIRVAEKTSPAFSKLDKAEKIRLIQRNLIELQTESTDSDDFSLQI